MTDLVLGAAEQGAGACVEDGIAARDGGGDLLGDLVAQVLDQDLVAGLVQHGKAVARDEDRRVARAPLGILQTVFALVNSQELSIPRIDKNAVDLAQL